MDIRIFDRQLYCREICDRLISRTVREEFSGEGACTLTVPLEVSEGFQVDRILRFPDTETDFVIRAVKRDSAEGICRVEGSGLLSFFSRRILSRPVTAAGEAEELLCSLAEEWGADVLPGAIRAERTGITASATAATGHDNLLTAMKRICSSVGLGMLLRLDADKREFVFSVRSRRENPGFLSRSAGTLSGVTERQDFTRYRNRAIIIGVGERTAVVEAAGLFDDGVDDSTQMLREIFEDASDLALGRFESEDAYAEALRTRGRRILSQHRPVCALSAEVGEETSRSLLVGDVCAVSDDILGVEASVLCTSRTVSGDGTEDRFSVTVQILNT